MQGAQSGEIVLTVPDWVDDADIGDWIGDQLSLLEPAFDLNVCGSDSRCQVDDTRITSVDLQDDHVTIFYEVDFSAYHGCKDVNYADTAEQDIEGRREGRTFFFARWVPPPPRDTFEEF